MKFAEINGLINAKSGEEAFSWLITRHNSFSRMETLLSAKEFMQWRVFYKALGLIWTISDNIYNHKLVLHDIFSNTTKYQLNLMMEPNERTTLKSMPLTFPIYRGCYSKSRNGFSWSIDRKVAEGFTLLHRYKKVGDSRLLLEAKVNRSNAILKLDREEFEIITTKIIEPIKTLDLSKCVE